MEYKYKEFLKLPGHKYDNTHKYDIIPVLQDFFAKVVHIQHQYKGKHQDN